MVAGLENEGLYSAEPVNEEYGKRIYNLLKELNTLFSKKLEFYFTRWGLTAPQIFVLSLLKENGEMKISEIADAMSLADSNVSGIVDRLEKTGYVERVRSSKDRRIVKARPTGKVDGLVRDYDSGLKEYFSQVLSNLSPKELGEIVDCMEMLRCKLDC